MNGRKAENLFEEQIRKFLTLSYGSGSGSGDGSGDGYGYGYGYGSGYGSGYGYGSGDGYGYGSGYGYGVKTIDGQKVWNVDEVQTIFNSVRGNVAKGYILNRDLTRTPCFVVRVGNSFAHGATLHEAVRDATAKDMERSPVSERIKAFVKAHPHKDVVISGRELYDWHHVLTGSCKAGRDAWCRDMGLDPDKDNMTVARFIELTKDSYGGEIIRRLAEIYKAKTRSKEE